MKKIGLLMAVCVTIACSGNGVDVEPSPFQGRYKGTWTGQGGGTAEVEIADDGSFTGKSHSYSYNMEGVLTGVIKNNGNVTLSVTYPDQEPINGSGEWSFNRVPDDDANDLNDRKGLVRYDIVKESIGNMGEVSIAGKESVELFGLCYVSLFHIPFQGKEGRKALLTRAVGHSQLQAVQIPFLDGFVQGGSKGSA